jgi:hypothetical protein
VRIALGLFAEVDQNDPVLFQLVGHLVDREVADLGSSDCD